MRKWLMSTFTKRHNQNSKRDPSKKGLKGSVHKYINQNALYTNIIFIYITIYLLWVYTAGFDRIIWFTLTPWLRKKIYLYQPRDGPRTFKTAISQKRIPQFLRKFACGYSLLYNLLASLGEQLLIAEDMNFCW